MGRIDFDPCLEEAAIWILDQMRRWNHIPFETDVSDRQSGLQPKSARITSPPVNESYASSFRTGAPPPSQKPLNLTRSAIWSVYKARSRNRTRLPEKHDMEGLLT